MTAGPPVGLDIFSAVAALSTGRSVSVLPHPGLIYVFWVVPTLGEPGQLISQIQTTQPGRVVIGVTWYSPRVTHPCTMSHSRRCLISSESLGSSHHTTWALWKHTGNTLATNNSFSSGIPVYTRVLIPGTLDCHWITTALPLTQGRDPLKRCSKYFHVMTSSWCTLGSNFDDFICSLQRTRATCKLTYWSRQPY